MACCVELQMTTHHIAILYYLMLLNVFFTHK
jgi:hypothetical protein